MDIGQNKNGFKLMMMMMMMIDRYGDGIDGKQGVIHKHYNVCRNERLSERIYFFAKTAAQTEKRIDRKKGLRHRHNTLCS